MPTVSLMHLLPPSLCWDGAPRPVLRLPAPLGSLLLNMHRVTCGGESGSTSLQPDARSVSPALAVAMSHSVPVLTAAQASSADVVGAGGLPPSASPPMSSMMLSSTAMTTTSSLSAASSSDFGILQQFAPTPTRPSTSACFGKQTSPPAIVVAPEHHAIASGPTTSAGLLSAPSTTLVDAPATVGCMSVTSPNQAAPPGRRRSDEDGSPCSTGGTAVTIPCGTRGGGAPAVWTDKVSIPAKPSQATTTTPLPDPSLRRLDTEFSNTSPTPAAATTRAAVTTDAAAIVSELRVPAWPDALHGAAAASDGVLALMRELQCDALREALGGCTATSSGFLPPNDGDVQPTNTAAHRPGAREPSGRSAPSLGADINRAARPGLLSTGVASVSVHPLSADVLLSRLPAYFESLTAPFRDAVEGRLRIALPALMRALRVCTTPPAVIPTVPNTPAVAAGPPNDEAGSGSPLALANRYPQPTRSPSAAAGMLPQLSLPPSPTSASTIIPGTADHASSVSPRPLPTVALPALWMELFWSLHDPASIHLTEQHIVAWARSASALISALLESDHVIAGVPSSMASLPPAAAALTLYAFAQILRSLSFPDSNRPAPAEPGHPRPSCERAALSQQQHPSRSPAVTGRGDGAAAPVSAPTGRLPIPIAPGCYRVPQPRRIDALLSGGAVDAAAGLVLALCEERALMVGEDVGARGAVAVPTPHSPHMAPTCCSVSSLADRWLAAPPFVRATQETPWGVGVPPVTPAGVGRSVDAPPTPQQARLSCWWGSRAFGTMVNTLCVSLRSVL